MALIWDFALERLPVGTFYCIGRNYAAHAMEMGEEPPTSPLVFLKPPSAYVPSGSVVFYPPFSRRLEYEGEIVVVLKSELFCATEAQAVAAIAGYAVGIDFTLRDAQHKAKRQGAPWAIAKAFERSAPVSAVVPASEVEFPLEMCLWVNGTLRQQASSEDMLWHIPQLVVYLSKVFRLLPGDAIFTGTPAGVGPVNPGEVVTAALRRGMQQYAKVEVRVEQSPCTP